MSPITLVQVNKDHRNPQITFHICLHNGGDNMGNKSPYQILEVLGTVKGKNCHSLVSSSKFRSFWFKHISHIFPPQSSYIIKTVIRAYELTDWAVQNTIDAY